MVSFTTESTIHGVIHIFGPNRSIFVRIFWILLFILSIFGLVFYVRGAYIKWLIDPDIVTKTREVNLKDFPIMAITICPTTLAEIKSLKLRNYNISSDFEVTEDECKNLRMDATWCRAYRDLVWCNVKNCNVTTEGHPSLSLSELYYFLNGTIYNRGGITDGKFDVLSENGRNSTNVHKVMTKFGICITHNMYTRSIFKEELIDNNYGLIKPKDPEIEWSADSKFYTPNPKNPKRFNDDELLNFVFTFMNDSRFCNKEQKLTVIAHQPNEYPTPYHPSIEVNADSTSQIFISIESFRSNENLRILDPKIRNCYYENERKLKIFKNYTQNHCKLECFNYIKIETEDCHLLYLPIEKNSSHNFCHPVNEEALDREIKLDATFQRCQCLPSCNYLEFKLRKDENFFAWNWPQKVLLLQRPNWVVVESERFATYTLSNFVAEIGGFLGLFMGCSLLSIVEIFFFMISKFITRMKKLIKDQPEEVSRDIDLKNDEEINSKLRSIEQRLECIELRIEGENNSQSIINDRARSEVHDEILNRPGKSSVFNILDDLKVEDLE